MKVRVLFTVLTCFLAVNLFGQQMGDLSKAECFLDDCSFMDSHPRSSMGYLTVPESYDNPQGKKLQIAYVILKSNHPTPEKDPVIIFSGGWGMPSITNTSRYVRMPLLKNRDLIFFDYRGTGYSTPLPCENLGEDGWKALMTDDAVDEFYTQQKQRYAACIAEMEAKGIDYQQYGMNTIAKDAAFLAQQLPYDSYNLFGISYGTMAIQHFIRAAEGYDLTVRSAVLDSNVPIGVPTQGTMSQMYKASLNKILADCANNPECNEAYPELKNRFLSFLDELETNPLQVTLDDGDSGYLNRQEVNGIIHQIIYDYRVYKNVPLLLEAFMQRDETVLKELIRNIKSRVLVGYNALGLVEYVYDHKISTGLSKQNYERDFESIAPYEVVDGYLPYYFEDTKITPDSVSQTPIQSNVPALILAGTYDPITPPEFSQKVRSSFSKHYYFEMEKIGHGAAPTPCGSELLISFVDNPNENPTSDCLEEVAQREIPFRTNIHENGHILSLSKGIFQGENMLLMVLSLFVVLLFLINLIVGIVALFRKNSSVLRKYRSLISILGILITAGLTYFISSTAATDSFLLLFGLPAEVNWVLLLSVPFLLGTIWFMVQLGKSEFRSKWNLISGVSFVLFSVGIVIFQLLPAF